MEREANELLRQARHRLPSRQTPGVCLSRQEVADQVNYWLSVHKDKSSTIDANYVGKLERGVIRWPQKACREALRFVFGVEADLQIGFYPQRRKPASVADVNRNQFLRISGAVAALPLLGAFGPVAPTPMPRRISRADIEQIRATATTFKRMDDAFGGAGAREAVTAQLRASAALLDVDCPAALRPGLFNAVGLLSSVAGFMAFDASAPDDARRAYRFGLACAEEVDDWNLRARLLHLLARLETWHGNPDRGLTNVEMALVRGDRLTATERAALHTIRARALAKLGKVQETLRAVGAADEAFAHADPKVDPPWMAYYDQAQHQGDTGHALFDLSVRGRPTEAFRRLTFSVAHHGPHYTRSRALSQTKAASLVMATGDPRRAAAIGNQALDAAHLLRSNRAVAFLRELHQHAGRHTKISDAVALRRRIVETVGVA